MIPWHGQDDQTGLVTWHRPNNQTRLTTWHGRDHQKTVGHVTWTRRPTVFSHVTRTRRPTVVGHVTWTRRPTVVGHVTRTKWSKDDQKIFKNQRLHTRRVRRRLRRWVRPGSAALNVESLAQHPWRPLKKRRKNIPVRKLFFFKFGK